MTRRAGRHAAAVGFGAVLACLAGAAWVEAQTAVEAPTSGGVAAAAAVGASNAPARVEAATNAVAPEAGTNAAAAQVATTNAAALRDIAAARFLNTCSGCHSVHGLKLTGPELSHVAAWPAAQLNAAIKRMEKNVGPLQDDTIAALSDLLRATDLHARLDAESARIQAQFAATLAPADAALGRRLFYGKTALAAGGLACASCHSVAGQGGNVGPDLSDVHRRLGQAPLISGIEKAAFKVMAPHYQRHPVTRQEALHIARFLATIDPAAGHAKPFDFLRGGAGLALVAFIGLSAYFRRGRATRGRLQRHTRGVPT